MKKYLGFIAATFLLVEGFGVGAAMAGDKYGAIATGANGAYGYSYNYDTREDAENAALYECGGTCSVQVWFANACGAVAKGDGATGWAWNANKTAAQNNAVASCYDYGGSNCQIVAWACTDR